MVNDRLTTIDALAAEYLELDISNEPAFEAILASAQEALRGEFAAITLFDQKRQWMRVSHGLSFEQVSIEASICAGAFADPLTAVAVPDLSSDPRFCAHAMVAGAPFLRFFSAAPICSPAGGLVGSICVASACSQVATAHDLELLAELAHSAGCEFEIRRLDRRIRCQLRELAALKLRVEHRSR